MRRHFVDQRLSHETVFSRPCSVVTLATLTAAPAVADDLDFSQIKCSDFVSGSKDDAVLMLTWLEGYFTKKSDPPIMHGEKAASDGTNIRAYCLPTAMSTFSVPPRR